MLATAPVQFQQQLNRYAIRETHCAINLDRQDVRLPVAINRLGQTYSTLQQLANTDPTLQKQFKKVKTPQEVLRKLFQQTLKIYLKIEKDCKKNELLTMDLHRVYLHLGELTTAVPECRKQFEKLKTFKDSTVVVFSRNTSPKNRPINFIIVKM